MAKEEEGESENRCCNTILQLVSLYERADLSPVFVTQECVNIFHLFVSFDRSRSVGG